MLPEVREALFLATTKTKKRALADAGGRREHCGAAEECAVRRAGHHHIRQQDVRVHLTR